VFNHRTVRGFAPLMRDVIKEKSAGLAARDGRLVPVAPEMLTLALDVLTACLFSGDSAIDTQRFSRDLDRLLHIAGMPHPLDLMGAPAWAPRFGRGEAERIVSQIRGQVGALLDARRRRQENDDASSDFVGLLMRAGAEEGEPLSDKEIVDNLITFLAAGHETTARTLTWTFYLLAKSPAATKRARAEIDAAGLDEIDPADWGAALPFVAAVIKESMRLYPAAAMLSRLALNDDTLAGVPVKAGTEIVTAPWVLHRHNKLWDRPNEFDPDRFLGERGDAIPRYAYMPFGAGPRICIGASFSMQEMIIAVAEILRAVDFAHAGAGEPQPIMRITVQPSTDVKMRVSLR
jgi:cytochrome P450